jgi:hypothetical protein
MVTDASACQLLDSVIVDENPEIFTTTSSNPATCFGYSDGSASISANGGVGTLSYLWSNQSQQEDIFGLTFGNYFVVVEDDLGCQVLDTVVVAQPNAIRILLESSNVLCNGDSTGVINSTVTGGTPFANGFYTYSWSSQNSQIGFNSPVLNNISSSPYPFQLEVVDNAGCSSSAFAFINEPEKLKLDTSDLVPAYCQNVETGQVSVYAEGGFLNSGGSYQYSWNNGVESAVLSNQNAGTYTAYVEDDNGCIDSMQVEIPLIPTFVSTIDSVPLNCFEDNSGVANIEIDGGFGPYTYSWYWQSSGSQQYVSTSNIFSKASLPAGVVSVVVVDVNGCYLSNQTQITQPQELLYSVIKDNDESCSGSQSACDGQLTFNLSGGTQPYLYEWMDLNNNLLGSTFSSSTNIQASNLCSGFYQFSVTDNKGCTATNSGNGLSSPVEIISGYEVISLIDENTYTNNILCFGDTSAFVSVLNPNSQFSYSWLLNDLPYSNGLSAIVPSGEITLRANFGACSTTSTPLLVDQPSATLINSNISHVNCFGYSSGSVEVEAINPQGLTYSWFDGSSATSIYNLSEGFYDLTIVNSLNCSTLYTFEVSEPDSLFVSPTITAVSCSNGDDGTASLLITGGVTPYQIDWQGIDPLNLQMGTYDILISDANSCLDSFELSIPESSSINASINVSGSSFSASANGGTPPYTYDWLYFGFNVGSGINFNPSQNGEYTLVVTDDNGCTDTDFQLYNTSVGLMEFGQDRFNIYPNPMQSFVTIENLIDKFEDVEFKLLDSRGRVVRSAIFKDKITIQRENLSSGLYMINLKTDLLTLKQKIIIYE